MRANVKHRLKIAWDDVHAVNPRLVYGSISGFGQTGPYGARAGVDQIAQGMGGLMSITGLPGQGPVRVGIPIADLTAGNLLAFGIMTALFERERTGVGRWVHTSLLEVQTFMLDFQAARWLMKGEVAGQAGNDHPTGIPTGVFPTSDGHINIAASSGRLWERFCRGDRPSGMDRAARLGHAEGPQRRPQGDQRRDRRGDQDQAGRALDRAVRGRRHPVRPDQHDRPGVRRPAGQASRPGHAGASTRGSGRTELVASPVNMSGHRRGGSARRRRSGASTPRQVLRGLGYGDAEIAELRSKGAI